MATAFIAVALVFIATRDLGWLLPFRIEEPLGSTLTRQLTALLVGGAAAAALGAIDDFLDLRARWQLAGQIVLGVFAVAFGISITFIANPFGGDVITFPDWFAAGFTIFWIVGMINSINFIDGLDGLSSGIAFIAAVTLGLINLSTSVYQPIIAVLCFILAGSLLGFLRWNLHPASIFAGTSGVQFVGYSLALLSILGTAKVAVALLVLGVPIIDTFWIIVRRLLEGRSPFSPDRGHIHHRMLDLGLSHRQTVFAIYGICLLLAASGAPAVGREPAVRVPRRLPGLRPRPLHPDARGPAAARGARGGRLRPRSGRDGRGERRTRRVGAWCPVTGSTDGRSVRWSPVGKGPMGAVRTCC